MLFPETSTGSTLKKLSSGRWFRTFRTLFRSARWRLGPASAFHTYSSAYLLGSVYDDPALQDVSQKGHFSRPEDLPDVLGSVFDGPTPLPPF